MNNIRKTATTPYLKKRRALNVTDEIGDRDQIAIEYIGASYFMESREFARGVDDVRAGRPACFDNYTWDQGERPATDRQWAYEKGRQFAIIAPKTMPLRIHGKLNLDALRLLVAAINRGDLTP